MTNETIRVQRGGGGTDIDDAVQRGKVTNVAEDTPTVITFSTPFDSDNYILRKPAVYGANGEVGFEIVSKDKNGFTIQTIPGSGVCTVEYAAIML